MSGNSAAYQPKEAEFHGQGIQNTGSIHVGRDVNIGMLFSGSFTPNSDSLKSQEPTAPTLSSSCD